MKGRGAGASRAALAGVLALALSCGNERPAGPPPEKALLGGEIAARVGEEAIPLALVVKVAAAQHITPREALARLVDDAICANAARARGLDREQPASWLLVAARGRVTAERLLSEARQAGPPTAIEIDELTKKYWQEVDRPPAVRVVHAVVRRSDPKNPDPAIDTRARALAPELRAALVGARDADDFLAQAKAFPHPGVDIVAERLPPIAEDGFVTEGTGSMDPAFTKGAFAIPAAGDTSPIVESPFGWHVIRLLERVPEQRMGLEARKIAFHDEVFMYRARVATETRMKALRAANPVEILPTADSLTRTLMPQLDRKAP